MTFPSFPAGAFVNALGDVGLVHIGRLGSRPIEGILSIEDGTEADGEYAVYVERITLDVLDKDADKLRKKETIRQGGNDYIIIAIPPSDGGMVEVVLERKQ